MGEVPVPRAGAVGAVAERRADVGDDAPPGGYGGGDHPEHGEARRDGTPGHDRGGFDDRLGWLQLGPGSRRRGSLLEGCAHCCTSWSNVGTTRDAPRVRRGSGRTRRAVRATADRTVPPAPRSAVPSLSAYPLVRSRNSPGTLPQLRAAARRACPRSERPAPPPHQEWTRAPKPPPVGRLRSRPTRAGSRRGRARSPGASAPRRSWLRGRAGCSPRAPGRTGAPSLGWPREPVEVALEAERDLVRVVVAIELRTCRQPRGHPSALRGGFVTLRSRTTTQDHAASHFALMGSEGGPPLELRGR